ncbi:HD domain-containing protein [soil metagenome]
MDLASAIDEDLGRQVALVLELDALKGIVRRSWLTDGSRRENSAEHSWHLALLALLLASSANEPVDVARVIELVLLHDVVEIDAGDTFVYDDEGRTTKRAREQACAERLFGLLPDEQAARLHAAWEEFEARQTPEARFAAALDRLQPLLLNLASGGRTWRDAGIAADRVLAVNAHIGEGSERLWSFARQLIEAAIEDGLLAPEADP